jgi:hypothetical protein
MQLRLQRQLLGAMHMGFSTNNHRSSVAALQLHFHRLQQIVASS